MPEKKIHRGEPQVSLATAVVARFVNTQVTRTGAPDYVPLTTNLGLKYRRRILYFPMDSSSIFEAKIGCQRYVVRCPSSCDLRVHKTRYNGGSQRDSATQSSFIEGPATTATNFQIMVANGQLENPKSRVKLKIEVGDIDFHEIFIVMEKLISPLIGLSFVQLNNTISEMRQGVLVFPFFSIQLKTADHK